MRFAKRNIARLVLAVLLFAGGPLAALDVSWPEESYNRRPAPGDLVLPMPCGGAMVFRSVDVPGDGVFDDQKITLGGRDPQRAYAEHVRPAYLSGTFRAKGAWRYYLGKYEVTNGQYAALNGACPEAGDWKTALPKVEVTMAEAVLTAERYTEWLFENARNRVPAENGTPGYIRLPTESEWEYAARGGIEVGPSDFEARLPPMEGSPEQFIVFCRTDCTLEVVGLLKPNPLGLHDMHGNAAELVHGLFRLNHVGREHGRAGAYVKRGGDFRTRLEQIHSGLREEFSPLGKRGLRREPGTGFRLALAAPALPDRARLEEARDMWSELAKTERVSLGEERADPRAELRTLADFASRLEINEAEGLKRRLLALADVMDTNISTRNEQRARAAREMLRVAVIAGLRLPEHQASVARCAELLKISRDRYKERCERVRRDSDYDLDFYIDHLTRMAGEFPDALLLEQVNVLEREFASRRKKALEGLPVVVANLDDIRTRGAESRDGIVASWNELRNRQ